MLLFDVLLLIGVVNFTTVIADRRCPKRPSRPEGCKNAVKVYTGRCHTGYDCKDEQQDVCLNAGAPVCPPAPSRDCMTTYTYKDVNGTRCQWECKHTCCKTEAEVLKNCPESNPSNPYCVSTTIVKYTIKGKQCPVYCGCVPDCRRLTC